MFVGLSRHPVRIENLRDKPVAFFVILGQTNSLQCGGCAVSAAIYLGRQAAAVGTPTFLPDQALVLLQEADLLIIDLCHLLHRGRVPVRVRGERPLALTNEVEVGQDRLCARLYGPYDRHIYKSYLYR